ncbi:GNAT family N-acetyltransferase [Alkaliphilus peptidifermentans]|uniref:Protein N-acetyltransferase, RimJ/RimL family n=1 Tax=Alkaliphilus peptidifermentans DSM 18978 TaxID=1120976 RepID=A0A1G5JSN9_9FIRM|nr:GNAT family protein [Alkaliphilus peptidifermentans]SCY90880.1 Protein N-acetyltransferase, RimJ/RimL family [Alkaliphilus peptidifermentans DSM 18978]
MNTILIKDEDIMLCPTTPNEIDEILEIERVQQDEENRRFVYLWSKERHLESIEMEDELHLVIRSNKHEGIIGYIIISGLSNQHDVIEFDRIALRERGKGYGRKSVRLIKTLCFENLKCNRLWLDVFDYNEKAYRLYKSEGFVHEGTLRQCKKYNDSYYSMHIMSMLKEEYVSSK